MSACPDHDTTMPAALLQDLVDANHILFREGVLDAFGHVSVRSGPDRFLLSASVAPAMVRAEDILDFDLDGRCHGDRRRAVYAERFIHAEIYRARPDVQAVVHSHAPSVLPFSLVGNARLRPVCHMSGFLREGAPVFDVRNVAGLTSDMLVRNRELGADLARTLGNEAVVLMRGHGSTVVGPSLKVAVYRAIYTEVNARIQLDAQRLGAPVYLTAGEAEATARANEAQVERPWQLWLARARRLDL
jgi:HCOMODA/2-hydroxy-3-carboxy-muconic semialdehyde decarboxylase